MATQPRISRLRFDDVATHVTSFLEWTVTAAVQDTAAGSSVSVTIVRSVAGAPPGDPESLTLRYATDTGTVIRTVTLNTTSASQTDTFFFTTDGTNTGTARCGTIEMKLQATRAAAVAYDVETDGSPNTAPAGFDTHLDRGWIRGTTAATTALSNISAGGGKNLPFSYDDDIFHRVVLGSAPFKSETVTHSTSTGGVSGTSTSATATFDRTFTDVVDNRFAATQTTQVGLVTFPNSTFSGSPWTIATVTSDSALTDPRITTTHLLQINDSAYGTPPISKADVDDTRETSDLGFLSFRLTNARGEGHNNIAVNQEIRDQANLLASGDYPSRSITTANRGGEDGWATTLMTWAESLPSGTWIHRTTITTADATGLDKDNTRNYTLKGVAYAVDPIDLALNGTLSHR